MLIFGFFSGDLPPAGDSSSKNFGDVYFTFRSADTKESFRVSLANDEPKDDQYELNKEIKLRLPSGDFDIKKWLLKQEHVKVSVPGLPVDKCKFSFTKLPSTLPSNLPDKNSGVAFEYYLGLFELKKEIHNNCAVILPTN